MADIWVEKYRPQVLQDVVGNGSAVQRLRACAEEVNMPHILLAGPPGCGKTTSVLCLARHLLGEENLKTCVLELNASDDRGIEVVRQKIKTFAQTKVTLPPGRFKLIILDEAEGMTEAAQQALRRTMEHHSSTTRFALACNASSKIIEPIQSRCAMVRFGRLQDHEVLERLLHVCAKESVNYTDKGLEAVVFTADGDMRHALNNLQSTHNGFAHVTQENVFKVCDQPHPLKIQSMLRECLAGNWDNAYAVLNDLNDQGYANQDIIGVIFRVLKTFDMPEHVKLEYLKEVGITHMRIAEGVGTKCQFGGLIGKLCNHSQVMMAH
jgi:replication factor C subunit 2/4